MLARRLAVLFVAGALVGQAPVAAETAASVRVDANAFSPAQVAVDVGGTVTWLVQEGGHTIKADDGRFHFRGSGGATLPAGSAVSFTFTGADEYVGYFCEIHGGAGGQGMAGRVQVGAPAAPPPHADPVIRVPEDEPTLAAAVARAASGHRIELGPGDHSIVSPVIIAMDGITVAGTDPSTRLVPVAGQQGFPSSALRISGSRVRIERLQVGAFRSAGIQLEGANSAAVVDVLVDGAGFALDGIVAAGVTGATLRGTTTIGNRRSGLRVVGCAACGVLIDGASSTTNGAGLMIEGARGVTARRSHFSDNAVGVSVSAARTTAPARWAVVSLWDNLVSANVQDGIRLSGVADSMVSRNRVVGSPNGFVVAGDVSQRATVHANVVDGVLAWDGVGIDVAFTDNRDSAGLPKEPTIDPAASLP